MSLEPLWFWEDDGEGIDPRARRPARRSCPSNGRGAPRDTGFFPERRPGRRACAAERLAWVQLRRGDRPRRAARRQRGGRHARNTVFGLPASKLDSGSGRAGDRLADGRDGPIGGERQGLGARRGRSGGVHRRGRRRRHRQPHALRGGQGGSVFHRPNPRSDTPGSGDRRRQPRGADAWCQPRPQRRPRRDGFPVHPWRGFGPDPGADRRRQGQRPVRSRLRLRLLEPEHRRCLADRGSAGPPIDPLWQRGDRRRRQRHHSRSDKAVRRRLPSGGG